MKESLQARVIHLHRTANDWDKYSEFIPEMGEIIIIDPSDADTYPALAIGNSKDSVKQLPRLTNPAVAEAIVWDENFGYIDSGNISDYIKLQDSIEEED